MSRYISAKKIKIIKCQFNVCELSLTNKNYLLTFTKLIDVVVPSMSSKMTFASITTFAAIFALNAIAVEAVEYTGDVRDENLQEKM